MAANIPASMNTINTIVSPCAGFSYQPPLPGQHIKYEFDINYVPGPYLKFSVVLPEENINIPLNQIFDSKPIFEGDECESKRDRMVFGVPCVFKICGTKKKCSKKIFGRRICLPAISYPCGISDELTRQVYLVKENFPSIHLFKIPKLGIEMDFNSSTNTSQRIELLSNSPLIYWIDLLIYCGINASDIDPNNKEDINKIFDKFLGVAGRTLSYLLRQYILYSVVKDFKLEIELSIRITKLIIDINLELDEFRIFAGSKEFAVKNLTYNIKGIDVLKNLNAERLEFKLTPTNFIINYVLGVFSLNFTPIDMIVTMLKTKINQLKTISGVLSIGLKKELETAEDALTYIQNLTDLGDYIPLIKGPGLNFFKEFIINLQPKLFVYLKICPLQGQVGVCGRLLFDPTEYFKKLGNFLIKNMSAGFDELEIYDEIPQNIIKEAPALGYLNAGVKKANNAIVYAGKQGLKLASDALNTKTQDFLAGVGFCAPL
jgi:hypothetical protein